MSAGHGSEVRGVAQSFSPSAGEWLDPLLSRRLFLQRGVAAAGLMIAGPATLLSACGGGSEDRETSGYGPLLRAGRELELPEGFRYVVISREGRRMADGLPTPGIPDGMSAFPSADGQIVLVRNHELFDPGAPIGPERAYDSLGQGGVTTLVFDPVRERTVDEGLVLNGTEKNCAGGPTPWLSWLSCEESTAGIDTGFSREHGYVFEVPAAARGPVDPVPLKEMGRFMHEACAVDPRDGSIYMTEDTKETDGFYRFTPRRPGSLQEGGALEMLRISGEPGYDTRTGQRVGEAIPTEWVPIADADPADAERNPHAVFEQGLDRGGAIFKSLEGTWWKTDRLFMSASIAGDAGLGQIWQYRPLDRESGELKLIAESDSAEVLDGPDNTVAMSGGAILVCEDGDVAGDEENYLRGVTPDGEVFPFARNLAPSDREDEEHAEFAGATFSPDGRWLFVSIQHPGTTFAITGPWERGPF